VSGKAVFEREKVQPAHRRAVKEEDARTVGSSQIGIRKRSVPTDYDL
jgi:hypothetical protein